MKKQVTIDFNTLSTFGLVYLINKQVLHPLGLALTRNLETGRSNGAIISPDLSWKFSLEDEEEYSKKLEEFLKHRKNILTQLLSGVEETE